MHFIGNDARYVPEKDEKHMQNLTLFGLFRGPGFPSS
jgi:hypothetical protein